jgi:hypothetical protein
MIRPSENRFLTPNLLLSGIEHQFPVLLKNRGTSRSHC